MYKEKLPVLLTLLFVSIKNRDVLEMIKCHRHLLSVFCMLECFVYTTNKSFITPLRLFKILCFYVPFNFDITKNTFNLPVNIES